MLSDPSDAATGAKSDVYDHCFVFSLLAPVSGKSSCWYIAATAASHSQCFITLFFYPRDAMLARVLAMALCLSVCVCHKSEFYRNGRRNRASF